MTTLTIRIRPATERDSSALEALVDAAVRGLGSRDYTPRQIESALRYIFGVDTQLIGDGTYYVAERDSQIVGGGGWSRRQTLFRGDQVRPAVDADGLLDPARDAAKIRAFYVHPAWARRGVGRQLLRACEQAARRAGFQRLELMATLTGAPLYAAHGFVAVEPAEVPMADGVTLPALRMAKILADSSDK
jgi:N-acetylglutamate synthase-like GNAT family acetyltransferase